MSKWFDQSMNANKLRQSYLKGFLDISGGGIYLRSDNSMNFFAGESLRPSLSIGGNKLTVYKTDITNNDDDVDINSLRHLKNLNQNVQEFMTGATNGQGNVTTGQITVNNQDINGNLTIGKTLVVGGNAFFKQNVGVAGNLQVKGDSEIFGNEYIHKALIVGGNCTIDGDLTVKGDVSMGDYHFSGFTISALHDVSINDNLAVGKKMKVASDASFGHDVQIAGHLSVASLSVGAAGNSSELTFGQKLVVTSDVSFNSKMNVGGDSVLNKTLTVKGAASLTDDLTVSGATTLNGGVTLSASTSSLTVNGFTTLNKKATLTNGLEVSNGNVDVTKSLIVGQDSSFAAKLQVTGNVAMLARLDLTGDASVNNLTAAQNINAPLINATEKLTVATDLTIYNDGTNSVINAASGNIYLNPGLTDTKTGLVHIKNGLTVDGSINFTGQWIRTDTNVQFTTQIDISNNGTGPAIICEQKGVNDVAYFLDDNFPVMKVLQGHKVAINKSSAAYDLDVNGVVHADTDLMAGRDIIAVGDFKSTAGNVALTNGKLAMTNGAIEMTNGSLTLTNGKVTTKTFEATSTSTFDATVTIAGGNLNMTAHEGDNSSQGFLVQF